MYRDFSFKIEINFNKFFNMEGVSIRISHFNIKWRNGLFRNFHLWKILELSFKVFLQILNVLYIDKWVIYKYKLANSPPMDPNDFIHSAKILFNPQGSIWNTLRSSGLENWIDKIADLVDFNLSTNQHQGRVACLALVWERFYLGVNGAQSKKVC